MTGMAEPIKDDCKICDIVLIGVALAVAGVLTYMAVDLATDGKLSGMFSGAAGKLASVSPIRPEAPGDSDAV
jgi:hypothetical protein